MYIWEIVKGMCEGKYKEGEIFQSDDYGDMIISEDGELCYMDYGRVPMITGDESKWRTIRPSNE